MNLAANNCRAEYVGVLPIIVTELKLRNIQRHIFGANFVETADDAALEDAPKPFS